jgi:hypothetical protein
MTTVGSNSVGRFDQKLAAQRLFPSLIEQLESQLAPQAQKPAGHTPDGAVYRS